MWQLPLPLVTMTGGHVYGLKAALEDGSLRLADEEREKGPLHTLHQLTSCSASSQYFPLLLNSLSELNSDL